MQRALKFTYSHKFHYSIATIIRTRSVNSEFEILETENDNEEYLSSNQASDSSNTPQVILYTNFSIKSHSVGSTLLVFNFKRFLNPYGKRSSKRSKILSSKSRKVFTCLHFCFRGLQEKFSLRPLNFLVVEIDEPMYILCRAFHEVHTLHTSTYCLRLEIGDPSSTPCY